MGDPDVDAAHAQEDALAEFRRGQLDGYRRRAEAAEAERDRLRAVVERAHDHVAADDQVLRRLATDDLVALIGVLRSDCARFRESVVVANVAADAAAEAVGNMAEYVSQAVAERDRLRAAVNAVRPLWDDLTDADEDGTVKQFSVAHYQAVDEALTQLDKSGEATDG